MRDFKEGKTVEIRVGELADYSACLPLFSLLYHGDIGADFKHTFEEFVENEDGVVLLAERSGKVVGVLVGS
jgi:ribosomal protein S18 acetylase RimI-like enzyme